MKRTRGKLFWKQTYYSGCSRHRDPDENCDICSCGFWEFNIKGNISRFIFKYFPKVWIFFANL